MSTALTEQDVFDAASKVFDSGKEPTNALVKKELGKGSYDIICPALRKWKKENKSSEHKNSEKPVPKELKELLWKIHENSLNRIWAEALNIAENEVKAEMFAVLENEIEQLKEENMHYKDMKIKVETMEKIYTSFNEREMYRDKKEKEYEEQVQNLQKTVTNLLEQISAKK